MRARERGVLFDVGHGAGSFSYQVARARDRPGVCPRHHLQRPARPQRRRARLRPGHHALEAAARWAWSCRRHPGHHVHARERPSGASTASARWRPAGRATCRSSSYGPGAGHCPTRPGPPRSSSACSSRGWRSWRGTSVTWSRGRRDARGRPGGRRRRRAGAPAALRDDPRRRHRRYRGHPAGPAPGGRPDQGREDRGDRGPAATAPGSASTRPAATSCPAASIRTAT